ncbi:Uncharacterized protein DBV15_04126 [Temnothorax longispinosus]|uniref:Uncharacterized protein n=1 Tax=Temnothorax longispinosus TaxID=300112 RepID=A0A4S2KC78_9HYME|nr:Uncharacterized protein DBV15_04126 [Temnothorax longispinosus]
MFFHRGPLELSLLVISVDPSTIVARAGLVDGIARTSLRDFIALVSGVSHELSVTREICLRRRGVASGRSRSQHADQSGAHGRTNTHDALAGPSHVAHGMTIHR